MLNIPMAFHEGFFPRTLSLKHDPSARGTAGHRQVDSSIRSRGKEESVKKQHQSACPTTLEDPVYIPPVHLQLQTGRALPGRLLTDSV
jgi:hypothetical protein